MASKAFSSVDQVPVSIPRNIDAGDHVQCPVCSIFIRQAASHGHMHAAHGQESIQSKSGLSPLRKVFKMFWIRTRVLHHITSRKAKRDHNYLNSVDPYLQDTIDELDSIGSKRIKSLKKAGKSHLHADRPVVRLCCSLIYDPEQDAET